MVYPGKMHGIPRYAMGFTMVYPVSKYHGIPWYAMHFTMVYQFQNTMVYHAFYHGLLVSKYHGIPWYTMHFTMVYQFQNTTASQTTFHLMFLPLFLHHCYFLLSSPRQHHRDVLTDEADSRRRKLLWVDFILSWVLSVQRTVLFQNQDRWVYIVIHMWHRINLCMADNIEILFKIYWCINYSLKPHETNILKIFHRLFREMQYSANDITSSVGDVVQWYR